MGQAGYLPSTQQVVPPIVVVVVVIIVHGSSACDGSDVGGWY